MIWWLTVAIIALYLISSLGRMSLALRRASRILRTAPRQTGRFTVGTGPELKVLLLGDSIAAAAGSRRFDESVGGRIAAELAKGRSVALDNEGEVGLRMTGLSKISIERKEDLAIVIIGANDVLRGTSNRRYQDAFEAFLTENYHLPLIITGPGEPSVISFFPFWLRWYFARRERRFGKIMAEVAKHHANVTYFDPHSQLKQVDWRKPGYTAADHFHPGPMGHELWFEIIRPALQRWQTPPKS